MTDISPLVYIKSEKCTLCYACVRVCPVDAIEVRPDNDYARIIANRCIGCGSCFNACSAKAINYRQSLDEVERLLSSEKEVAAVLDPSIAGEFEDILDYRKFVNMLRMAGFSYVHEAAFSVDLVGLRLKKLLDDFKGKYYISSFCPVTVDYIEKYRPELIDNLTPIVNPSVASAAIVRSAHKKPDLCIVYIGPCIALKNDALKHSGDFRLDAVITFEELRVLFDKKNISEQKTEFSDYDAPLGNLGHLFPIRNGVLQASNISETLIEGGIATQDGPLGFVETLEEYHRHLDIIQTNLNIFYCRGCMMGPGMTSTKQKHYRRSLVIKYCKKRSLEFNSEQWLNDIASFEDMPFACQFSPNDQRLSEPPEDKISEILSLIHKDDNGETGCFNCGYENCRSFAVAVAHGLAKTEMCFSYNLKNKQEYIEALRNSNERLAQTQKALKESEQKAKHEQHIAQEASDRMKTLLRQLPSGIVIIDNALKIVQANENFIELLGSEAKAIDEIIPGLEGADIKSLLPPAFISLFQFTLTKDENVISHDVHFNNKLLNVSVFGIRKNRIIGAVIRDMYLPEVRKEEVIARVNEVITQNLNMVQQIAFLLGEGAAKTERMLNTVIESYQSQPQENDKTELNTEE